MELKPIEEAQTEAEKFFEREDVQALFHEACRLSTCSLPNYQLGKTLWKRMYDAPHPSKQKRDELYKLERAAPGPRIGGFFSCIPIYLPILS